MASAQPPFEYLISSSEESLESFELSRLSHVANLRKELRTVLDEFVEAEIQARIARWILEGRRAQDHRADHGKNSEYTSIAPRTQKPGPHKSLASQSATRPRQNSFPQHVDAADRIEQAHDIDHDAGNDAGAVAGNGVRETEVRKHDIRENDTRRPARAASQLPLLRARQSPSPEATPIRRAIVSQDPSMILRSLEHCAASAANALASCAADAPGKCSRESARRVRGASHSCRRQYRRPDRHTLRVGRATRSKRRCRLFRRNARLPRPFLTCRQQWKKIPRPRAIWSRL